MSGVKERDDFIPPSPVPITVAPATPTPGLSCLWNSSGHFIIPSLFESNGRMNRTTCLDQPNNKRPSVTSSDGFQFCRNYRTDLKHRVPRAGRGECHLPSRTPSWVTGDSVTKARREWGQQNPESQPRLPQSATFASLMCIVSL